MDPVDTLAIARALIDIDSTTGREGEAGRWVADFLRRRGYRITEQLLSRGCGNVFATVEQPVVVFSTHFDCVPPFFPSTVRDDRLYGRGACDAKGILAAQIAAAERLHESGERRVGLLFVAGEERGSDGAAAANALLPGSRFLINGEPTGSRLASATRGVLRVRLSARGRAAHSAAPEHGESAIEKLIDALLRLRDLPLPVDAELGATFYTVGLIEGGVAPNVVPAHAAAEVLFRTVGPAEHVIEALRPLAPIVSVDEVLRVPPVRMHTVPGFETAVFPFTTDVPLLDRWGLPLLFGPGSFLLAHTDEEHIPLGELHAAVGEFERLARACLEGNSARPLGTSEVV
ncbi:MAG TPA: M20/M25/M40 family metallo-hydrolase [Vicinamibacterales bacterium]|nr:M20/M25/M40 family metallo-hydrolase [Vicinamibacterales bacterium]